MKSLLKKCIRKVVGKIKRIYHRYMDEPLPIMEHEYDARELFLQEDKSSGFNRYDMIVRLLAIENYYGKNDFGFKLYRKMQRLRINEEWVEPAVERFIALIKSYEENGYDNSSYIEIDNNLGLVDGSHRMALAMYHKHYQIQCHILPFSHPVKYDISVFVEMGFSKDEIDLMVNRYQILKKEIVKPFVATLWAPAAPYFDEIIDKLRFFGRVTKVTKLKMSEHDYRETMLAIYFHDDVPADYTKQKLELQKKYEKQLCFVELEVDDLTYRQKAGNLNLLSTKFERIKRCIRTAYKDKYDDYVPVHDCIIHVGDNYLQNDFIRQWYTNYQSVPVALVFESVKQYDYALIKTDTPYFPSGFPNTYPLHKDADIIVSKKDQRAMFNTVLRVVEAAKSTFNWRVEYIEKQKDGSLSLYIYIYIYDRMIYGFDFDTSVVSEDFCKSLLSHREKANGYYKSDESHDFVIRLHEYMNNPSKRYHRDWILKMYKSLSPESYELFLTSQMRQTLDEIVQ